mmetsp:Transcript_104765/g.146024  ORF Transcript_104765/g.146024 Transcript_104765/m.146024 type:complete len:199 (-) Transcript_104765:45-641(-)
MGISRDSTHKRRATGGRRKSYRKKRKFELGRQAAGTRIGPKRIHQVRGRGGNFKLRALRLDSGNFSWASESVTRKARILGVVYNASNNELVRTNTLVKSCIIQIDANPFGQWYQAHYGVGLGRKKDTEEVVTKQSGHAKAIRRRRAANQVIDPAVADQFKAGRLYACVSSRPGQSGRCDGYILEGPELEFYIRKLKRK